MNEARYEVHCTDKNALADDGDEEKDPLSSCSCRRFTIDLREVMSDPRHRRFKKKIGSDNANVETVMGKHGPGSMKENGEIFSCQQPVYC